MLGGAAGGPVVPGADLGWSRTHRQCPGLPGMRRVAGTGRAWAAAVQGRAAGPYGFASSRDTPGQPELLTANDTDLMAAAWGRAQGRVAGWGRCVPLFRGSHVPLLCCGHLSRTAKWLVACGERSRPSAPDPWSFPHRSQCWSHNHTDSCGPCSVVGTGLHRGGDLRFEVPAVGKASGKWRKRHGQLCASHPSHQPHRPRNRVSAHAWRVPTGDF